MIMTHVLKVKRNNTDKYLKIKIFEYKKPTRAVWEITCSKCNKKDKWDTPFIIWTDRHRETYGSCSVDEKEAASVFHYRGWNREDKPHRFLPTTKKWFCPLCVKNKSERDNVYWAYYDDGSIDLKSLSLYIEEDHKRAGDSYNSSDEQFQ